MNEPRTFRPKNYVYGNLEHMLKELDNFGLKLSIADLVGSLEKIAKRSVELNDKILLDECEHLDLVQEL